MRWIEVMVSSSGRSRRLTINTEKVACVRSPHDDEYNWCFVDMAHGQDWDWVLHSYRDVVDALYAEGVFVSLVDEGAGDGGGE